MSLKNKLQSQSQFQYQQKNIKGHFRRHLSNANLQTLNKKRIFQYNQETNNNNQINKNNFKKNSGMGQSMLPILNKNQDINNCCQNDQNDKKQILKENQQQIIHEKSLRSLKSVQNLKMASSGFYNQNGNKNNIKTNQYDIQKFNKDSNINNQPNKIVKHGKGLWKNLKMINKEQQQQRNSKCQNLDFNSNKERHQPLQLFKMAREVKLDLRSQTTLDQIKIGSVSQFQSQGSINQNYKSHFLEYTFRLKVTQPNKNQTKEEVEKIINKNNAPLTPKPYAGFIGFQKFNSNKKDIKQKVTQNNTLNPKETLSNNKASTLQIKYNLLTPPKLDASFKKIQSQEQKSNQSQNLQQIQNKIKFNLEQRQQEFLNYKISTTLDEIFIEQSLHQSFEVQKSFQEDLKQSKSLQKQKFKNIPLNGFYQPLKNIKDVKKVIQNPGKMSQIFGKNFLETPNKNNKKVNNNNNKPEVKARQLIFRSAESTEQLPENSTSKNTVKHQKI